MNFLPIIFSEEEIRKAITKVHPVSYSQKIVSHTIFASYPSVCVYVDQTAGHRSVHLFANVINFVFLFERVGLVWTSGGHSCQFWVLSGQLQLAARNKAFQGIPANWLYLSIQLNYCIVCVCVCCNLVRFVSTVCGNLLCSFPYLEIIA